MKMDLSQVSKEEMEAEIERREKTARERYEYTDWTGRISHIQIDSDNEIEPEIIRPKAIRQLITALTNFADDNNL